MRFVNRFLQKKLAFFKKVELDANAVTNAGGLYNRNRTVRVTKKGTNGCLFSLFQLFQHGTLGALLGGQTISFATQIDAPNGQLCPTCREGDVLAKPLLHGAVHLALEGAKLGQSHSKSHQQRTSGGDEAGVQRHLGIVAVGRILDAELGAGVKGVCEKGEKGLVVIVQGFFGIAKPSREDAKPSGQHRITGIFFHTGDKMRQRFLVVFLACGIAVGKVSGQGSRVQAVAFGLPLIL